MFLPFHIYDFHYGPICMNSSNTRLKNCEQRYHWNVDMRRKLSPFIILEKTFLFSADKNDIHPQKPGST